MLKLYSNLSNILFKGGQIMKLWKKGIILGMVVALAIVCVPEMYGKPSNPLFSAGFPDSLPVSKEYFAIQRYSV